DLQVYAVEKGPGYASLIIGGAARSPLAGLARTSAAAAARVHGSHELDARGISDPVIGARDHRLSGLERLAQRVEHLRRELRQLVEEQHAEMRQRDLTGLRPRAAADEGCHARRMMRGPERPLHSELAAH